MEKLPLQQREASIDGPAPSADARTFEIAIASGCIVDRYWGREQLDCSPGAVVMDRAGQEKGIPLLFNHDSDELIGRVHGFRCDADGVCRGTATLATTEDALEALQLIQDGALVDVSVGYRIHEIKTINANRADEINLVTRWEPYEVSLVSIPADATVGVGRAASDEYPLTVTRELETPTLPAPTVAGTPEVRMDTTITPAASPAAPPINLAELQTKAAQEALQIRALAAKFGLERDAEELLQTKSIDETRTELLFRITDKNPVQSAPVIDLTEKEAKSWSLVRAITALVDQAEGRKASGFELEISQELAKRTPGNYEAKGGIFIPMQLRAGLDSATGTKGNELKFSEYGGELIEMLRNAMVLQQLGVRTLSGLSSPLSFPAQTAAATGYWLGENGGVDVTASTLTLGSRTLVPKTLQATTSFSRQLLNQAVYGVEQLVREDFVAVHARAIDKAGIYGTGTTQPTGIYKTANVNSTAWGGAATWVKLMEMISKVATANALNGSLGFVTNPNMAGVLSTKQKATNFPSYLWEGKLDNGIMGGYKALASNQISAVQTGTDETGGSEQGIIFGNWADAILGFWGPGPELILDPYALKKQGMIELTSFQMCDFLVRHPGSFTVGTGLTTA